MTYRNEEGYTALCGLLISLCLLSPITHAQETSPASLGTNTPATAETTVAGCTDSQFEGDGGLMLTCHCKGSCGCCTAASGCQLCNDKQQCAVGYTGFPACQTNLVTPESSVMITDSSEKGSVTFVVEEDLTNAPAGAQYEVLCAPTGDTDDRSLSCLSEVELFDECIIMGFLKKPYGCTITLKVDDNRSRRSDVFQIRACYDPVFPANLTQYITNTGVVMISGKQRRRFSVYIPCEDITSNCDHIVENTIRYTVTGGTGVGADRRNGQYVTNLDAVTEYSITVYAQNDQRNEGNNTFVYKTGELAPYTVPYVDLKFTSSCVNLSFREPDKPNGQITKYEYSCRPVPPSHQQQPTTAQQSQTVLVRDLVSGIAASVCDFTSTTRIECAVSAWTSIGKGPANVTSGITEPKVDSSKPRITHEATSSVDIEIYPVNLDNSNTKIRSYLVVISKEGSDSEGRSRALSELCDSTELVYSAVAESRNQSCYIAAEIPVWQVTPRGYKWTYYGANYNQPLEKLQYIHIGFNWENREEGYQPVTGTYFPDQQSLKLREMTKYGTTSTPHQKRKTSIHVGAGVGAAVVALVCVGAAVAILVRRRKRKASDGEVRASPTIADDANMERNREHEMPPPEDDTAYEVPVSSAASQLYVPLQLMADDGIYSQPDEHIYTGLRRSPPNIQAPAEENGQLLYNNFAE